MKKLFLTIIAILFTVVCVPEVNAEEKVQVYMFSKEGCPACEAAEEYFDELENEYPDLFEVTDIRVFNNDWSAVTSELQDLLISVYAYFDEDTSKASTPTIVIGDYITVGFPNNEDEVYDAIVEARDADEKIDVVMDLADENEFDLKGYLENDGQTSTEEPKDNNDAIIIIGIFVVLIGGFAGLIILGKK